MSRHLMARMRRAADGAARPRMTTQDVIDQVRDQTGINLRMTNTGGNCNVLEGRLEDGSWIRAADHDDFCHWDLEHRHDDEAQHGPMGWDVSFHSNEHDEGGTVTYRDGTTITFPPSDSWMGSDTEPIHWHSDPDAHLHELPRVIGDAFASMPPDAKRRHQEELREQLTRDGWKPGDEEWRRHFPNEGPGAAPGADQGPDYEKLINPKPLDDDDFGDIFGKQSMLSPWRTAAPNGDENDPVVPVPTGDLLRHRIFNPAITTPEEMHESLWRPTHGPGSRRVPAPPPSDWYGSSEGGPWFREEPDGYERRDDRDHGFRQQGGGRGTEDGLVEAIERGDRLDPVEVTTNGVSAVLSDGNHRAEVADMMSLPELDTRLVYWPHTDELHENVRNPARVDPSSGLGGAIHEVVQGHPYEPVSEHGFQEDKNGNRVVFRRDPASGLWTRGQAWYWYDTVDARRPRDLRGGEHDWDGPGRYHEVWFPGGERFVHERHLHASMGRVAQMSWDEVMRHIDEQLAAGDAHQRGGEDDVWYDIDHPWYDDDRWLGPGRYRCAGCGEVFNPNHDIYKMHSVNPDDKYDTPGYCEDCIHQIGFMTGAPDCRHCGAGEGQTCPESCNRFVERVQDHLDTLPDGLGRAFGADLRSGNWPRVFGDTDAYHHRGD